MRRALLALVFSGTLLAIPAGAQVEASPELELGLPNTVDAGPIPLAPNATELMAPWTYRFDNVASAAAAFGVENVTLSWSLACVEPGVHLIGAPTTSIAYKADQAEYAGVALLPIAASLETPGEVPLDCTLSADASAEAEAMEANAIVEFEPEAAFRGEIKVQAPAAKRQSGPQKQIPYEIEVENLGNARTHVTFELLDKPGGKWIAILPEILLLDPGTKETSILTVATPFHNGYNSGHAEFTVRAIPSSPKDPQDTWPSQDVVVGATVQGWYIPGPSPVLAFAALALAALVVRRRR